MSSCELGVDLFGCQNHTYSHQHVRALYGSIFNSSEDFQMGKNFMNLQLMIFLLMGRFGARHLEVNGLGAIMLTL